MNKSLLNELAALFKRVRCYERTKQMENYSCICSDLYYLGFHISRIADWCTKHATFYFVSLAFHACGNTIICLLFVEKRSPARFSITAEKCAVRYTHVIWWYGVCCMGRTIFAQQPCSNHCNNNAI